MTTDNQPIRPRHLRPHAEFGDDPSGWCGCADCDPRDTCGCRACIALRAGVDGPTTPTEVSRNKA